MQVIKVTPAIIKLNMPMTKLSFIKSSVFVTMTKFTPFKIAQFVFVIKILPTSAGLG